jgi:hypothetical protein
MMLDPVALDYFDYIKPYLKSITNWHLHFCVIPRRCILTDKILWLKDCYKGTRFITTREFPFNEEEETLYIESNAFLLWTLKNYD